MSAIHCGMRYKFTHNLWIIQNKTHIGLTLDSQKHGAVVNVEDTAVTDAAALAGVLSSLCCESIETPITPR